MIKVLLVTFDYIFLFGTLKWRENNQVTFSQTNFVINPDFLNNYLYQTKLCSSICEYFNVLYYILHSIRQL